MTDSRTRQLRRSLDPSAGVALLADRVRTGDLSRDMLELAAYCGHEAARELAGKPDWCYACESACLYGGAETRTGAMRCSSCLDFEAWLRGLERWDGALLRAAIAAGWVAYKSWLLARGWCWDMSSKWEKSGDGLWAVHAEDKERAWARRQRRNARRPRW